jgi:integrase
VGRPSKPRGCGSRRSGSAVTTPALREHRERRLDEREDGTPIWPRAFSRTFDRHVKAAGLPRIPLKNLRHTHATILLANSVPPKGIQERLGHADITITLRVYAHAIPAMHAEATAKAAALIDA